MKTARRMEGDRTGSRGKGGVGQELLSCPKVVPTEPPRPASLETCVCVCVCVCSDICSIGAMAVFTVLLSVCVNM